MANTLNTLSPTLAKVLEIAKLGVAVTPTEINNYVGKGNYASKHVLYLKILGFDFETVKDGRTVVAYKLIKEPDNVEALKSGASNKKSKVKAPKVAAPKLVKSAPKVAVASKSAQEIEDIKAKNLATLKAVAAARKKSAKIVREYDDVTEQFGTSGEVGTSFNVDRDWDSIDGLDLSKLI